MDKVTGFTDTQTSEHRLIKQNDSNAILIQLSRAYKVQWEQINYNTVLGSKGGV